MAKCTVPVCSSVTRHATASAGTSWWKDITLRYDSKTS